MKLTIEMKAKTDKTQELNQTLYALLPAIRREKGCRECRVCRDLEHGDLFFIEADWDARTSLEKFLQSPPGGALLGAIDLLSEAPRVNFGGNEPWVGVNTLRKMRKKDT